MASSVFLGCHVHLREAAPADGSAAAAAGGDASPTCCPNDALRAAEKSGATAAAGTRIDCEATSRLLLPPPSVASATGPAVPAVVAAAVAGSSWVDGPNDSSLIPRLKEISSWDTAAVIWVGGGEDGAGLEHADISDPNAEANSDADGMAAVAASVLPPPLYCSALEPPAMSATSAIPLLSRSVGSVPSRDCRLGSCAGDPAGEGGDCSSADGGGGASFASPGATAEAELARDSREATSRTPLPLMEGAGEISIVWAGIVTAAGVLWGRSADFAAFAGSLQCRKMKGGAM